MMAILVIDRYLIMKEFGMPELELEHGPKFFSSIDLPGHMVAHELFNTFWSE